MSKIKTSWDLSLIVKNPTEKEFSKLREKVKKESYKFVRKWKDRKDYLKDPKTLKEALDEYNFWYTHFSNNSTEWYFYQMLFSLNQNDPKIKASLNIAQEFGTKIQNDIQFFEYNISKIDSKIQSKFLKEPILSPYKHFLEKCFMVGKHILSDPEEKIMNLKSAPAHENWIKMLQGFLSKEERVVLAESGKKEAKNFSDLLGLMESQNKKVRDIAAHAFNEIITSHTDVAESEINSILQNKKVNDELRGYERPDKARHLSDDIDSEVVDSLIKSVSNHFDIAKRYYKLKAKLSGVKKLAYHERNVEYGKIPSGYSYEKTTTLLESVFENLDSEFGDIFRKFVYEGRVDVYPKKGKRSGAFCSYGLITHPVYILLNWTSKLNDIRTFAHEMGHGINDELIKRSQNALNFGTPTSTAEVASTFMEDFVTQKLQQNAEDETRLALMMSKLNQDISSIFRQIAFYNFEWELHQNFRQKGYLSKTEIGKLFTRHMKSYMGPYVEQSAGSENWWVYVSHFRSFFYVYSYASGLLISKSLQASVKKSPQFIIKVKEFLSAGLSDSPKNIFLKLGIDISDKKFWEKGITEVEILLSETEKLAKSLRKI